MPAQRPEDICRLFQQAMAAGDMDAVLRVYDPEAVLLNHAGEGKTGEAGLRQELAPLVAQKARFAVTIKQVIQAAISR